MASFELLVGCWLIVGRKAHAAILVATALFLVFSGVAAGKLLAGNESCGCFGAYDVSPTRMLAVDVTTVLGLGAAGWRRYATDVPSSTKWGAVLVQCSLAVIIVGTALAYSLLGFRRPIALAPEHWIGRPLPIDTDSISASQIATGTRFIVCFRRDCAHCREVVPLLARIAEHDPVFAQRLVFFDLSARHLVSQDRGSWEWLDKYWVVRVESAIWSTLETPMVVQLENGRVQRVWMGAAVPRWVDRLRGTESVFDDGEA